MAIAEIITVVVAVVALMLATDADVINADLLALVKG
jgi:hypothetical protein